MLAGLLILSVASVFGVVLLSRLEFPQERCLWLTGGTVVGIAAFTALSYALSLILRGPKSASLPVWLGMAAWTIRELRSESFLKRWRSSPIDRAALALWGGGTLLFLPIGGKLLFEKSGSFWTGIVSAFGDVAWHVSSITAFVEGQTFPPVNPIHAGHPLVYPFLVNWLSATMLAWGSSLGAAVDWPAVLLVPALAALYFGTVRELTGRRLAAGIAVTLFVFAGSVWGAKAFGREWSASGKGLLDFLLHLPGRDFSGSGGGGDGLHFLNPITSLLLPQRTFLMGIPMALLILSLWFMGRDRKTAVAAGLLAGALPGFHLHTILALVPALVFLTPMPRWKDAPRALGAAAAIGLPAVAFFVWRGSLGNHLSVHLGWMADKENWCLYWLKNAGVVFPLAAALVWKYRREPAGTLAAAGLVLFAACNVFQFARWIWDNYKLIAYAWLFVLPLIGLACAQFVERRPGPWAKAAVAAFVLIHSASGVLDLGKLVLPTSSAWVEWDADARRAAAAMKRFTPPLSRVAAAPIHNSPIFLAGRIAYLGYPAHVWSHGGDPWKRELDLKSYFNGTSPTLPEPVDFVLVGPTEAKLFPRSKDLRPGPSVYRDEVNELFRFIDSK